MKKFAEVVSENVSAPLKAWVINVVDIARLPSPSTFCREACTKTAFPLLLGVATLVLGCGVETNNYVGIWQGRTSDNGPVAFTVQKNNTVFCFEFSSPKAGIGTWSPGCNSTTSPPDTQPIDGNSFSINGDGTFQGSGEFTSFTNASGRIHVTALLVPYDITWTATKQP